MLSKGCINTERMMTVMNEANSACSCSPLCTHFPHRSSLSTLTYYDLSPTLPSKCCFSSSKSKYYYIFILPLSPFTIHIYTHLSWLAALTTSQPFPFLCMSSSSVFTYQCLYLPIVHAPTCEWDAEVTQEWIWDTCLR